MNNDTDKLSTKLKKHTTLFYSQRRH